MRSDWVIGVGIGIGVETPVVLSIPIPMVSSPKKELLLAPTELRCAHVEVALGFPEDLGAGGKAKVEGWSEQKWKGVFRGNGCSGAA